MKSYRWLTVPTLAMALVAGCEDDGVSPTESRFSATLNGASERPTPNTSAGAGTATFTVSADRNTLSWNITMTGTNNVTASHIHVGGKEVAGPIAFGLFSATPTNNPAITGSVTRATYTSPLGISFDALLSLMESGDTYVNVHTDNGVAPQNTGPGDLAAGEIRGQITRIP
ncbi:MAG TPA: CHRD domain-containing protein [Gemmatimonadaceae bacterium]|nr:CHRD domain-containing protein [Gemmatimonadaceae bacterium]